jgi:hypothetical protein
MYLNVMYYRMLWEMCTLGFHVENLWQYNRPVGRKLDSYTGDINPLIPRSAI